MLQNRIFGGQGFLLAVRSLMNSGGGIFAARDGALRYVFLDADFFRLRILRRPANQTFTVAALASGARVVANGQTFADYCYMPSEICSVPWQGQIISNHTTLPGDPASQPLFRYFGQTDGASADAYRIDMGDPGNASPPLAEALGRLLPLVHNKVQSATPANTGTFWSRPATTGKTVYGIARNINAVLVLVQQDNETGVTVANLAQLIANAGVDQAVMGDGSDSATLVVNGTVEVAPGEYFKNRAIPNGAMFVQHVLALTSAARVSNNAATTDPGFRKSFAASGQQGYFQLDAGGIKLRLTSLGARSDNGNDLAGDLGVTLPVTLQNSSAQLPPTTAMIGRQLTLVNTKMTRTVTLGGELSGQLTVHRPSGKVVLNVSWPLVVV